MNRCCPSLWVIQGSAEGRKNHHCHPVLPPGLYSPRPWSLHWIANIPTAAHSPWRRRQPCLPHCSHRSCSSLPRTSLCVLSMGFLHPLSHLESLNACGLNLSHPSRPLLHPRTCHS